MITIDQIRCVSLWQPHAALMQYDEKRIETRPKPTSYRGPLVICSTKSFNEEQQTLCNLNPFNEVLRKHLPRKDHGDIIKALPRGFALAVVEIFECVTTEEARVILQQGRESWPRHELSFGNFAGNRYAWLTRNCQPLEEPIAVNGFQQLWKPTRELLGKLRRQVEL